jgi:lipid II:glycine glycyltransferase (peptidoglycan interpeptide bridge formation enzyme)
MLSISRKIKGLCCRELYFYPELPPETVGEDIQYFIQSNKPFPNAEQFLTSVIDLHANEETLFNAISKGFCYEIRRARDTDNVEITILDAPSHQDIERFASFFNLFAASKNLASANKEKLIELAAHSALVLSISKSSEASPDWLSAHAYICDKKRARLLYSARNVSFSTTKQKSLVGRANKYMHWHVLIHFKSKGYEKYDFGGISKLPGLSELNKYKEAFGGRETLEYNSVIGVSTKGKAAVLIYRVRNKLKEYFA